jgi:hypothetical protein
VAWPGSKSACLDESDRQGELAVIDHLVVLRFGSCTRIPDDVAHMAAGPSMRSCLVNEQIDVGAESMGQVCTGQRRAPCEVADFARLYVANELDDRFRDHTPIELIQHDVAWLCQSGG